MHLKRDGRIYQEHDGNFYAPVHNIVEFHVMQFSKTKRAKLFFVFDSFQGNCMKSGLKSLQPSIHFGHEQCFWGNCVCVF